MTQNGMKDEPFATIKREVKGWPGVTTGDTGRGGVQFNYGRVQLGHLQGSNIADLPFPKKVRNELIAEGRASVHPPVPDSGWVRKRIERPEDTEAVIGLFRMNYDRAKAHAKQRSERLQAGELCPVGEHQTPSALSAEKGASMAIQTDTTDRVSHILALMKKGDDAFNRRDAAAMDAVHHPDMVAHIMGSAEPINGRDAHTAAMEGMFRAFPDVHVYNDPYPIQFGQGDWMTVVTKATGTFSGELALPDGTVIPGTGKSFEVNFSTTARWEGDLLVEEYVFWDSALMNQQIGLA